MKSMAMYQHVDKELFTLFVKSGVYLSYAEQFLKPEQIDKVEIETLLSEL